ncbi:hypothetical protein SRHO_G00075960 [Serrasalmus rhombeus]
MRVSAPQIHASVSLVASSSDSGWHCTHVAISSLQLSGELLGCKLGFPNECRSLIAQSFFGQLQSSAALLKSSTNASVSCCGVIFKMETVAGAGVLVSVNKLPVQLLALVFPLDTQESLMLGLLREGECYDNLSK